MIRGLVIGGPTASSSIRWAHNWEDTVDWYGGYVRSLVLVLVQSLFFSLGCLVVEAMACWIRPIDWAWGVNTIRPNNMGYYTSLLNTEACRHWSWLACCLACCWGCRRLRCRGTERLDALPVTVLQPHWIDWYRWNVLMNRLNWIQAGYIYSSWYDQYQCDWYGSLIYDRKN